METSSVRVLDIAIAERKTEERIILINSFSLNKFIVRRHGDRIKENKGCRRVMEGDVRAHGRMGFFNACTAKQQADSGSQHRR